MGARTDHLLTPIHVDQQWRGVCLIPGARFLPPNRSGLLFQSDDILNVVAIATDDEQILIGCRRTAGSMPVIVGELGAPQDLALRADTRGAVRAEVNIDAIVLH